MPCKGKGLSNGVSISYGGHGLHWRIVPLQMVHLNKSAHQIVSAKKLQQDHLAGRLWLCWLGWMLTFPQCWASLNVKNYLTWISQVIWIATTWWKSVIGKTWKTWNFAYLLVMKDSFKAMLGGKPFSTKSLMEWLLSIIFRLQVIAASLMLPSLTQENRRSMDMQGLHTRTHKCLVKTASISHSCISIVEAQRTTNYEGQIGEWLR
jgi:hypothetical protein